MTQPRRRMRISEHAMLIRRALQMVWQGGRGWSAASFVLLAIQGVLPIASLYLLKVVLDAISLTLAAPAPRDPAPVFASVAALAGIAALTSLCRAAAAWISEGQALAVSDHVQGILHDKSVRVDLAYYETSRYYDALHRAQLEGGYRPTLIASGVVTLLQSTISLTGVLGLIIAFDVRLAAVLVLAGIPGLLMRLGFANRLFRLRWDRTQTQRKADYLHMVMTTGQHAREVRLFDLGSELIRRFGEIRTLIRGERLSLAARLAWSDFATQLLAVATMFAAFGYTIHLTLLGTLTVGALVMYYQAIQRGQSFLSETLRAMATLYEGNLYLANLYDFLALEEGIVDGPEAVPVPGTWTRGIELQRVTFQYPDGDKPVLEEVSLHIAPGEVVALVGENGSGKTTLTKLLGRLYDPSSGSITLEARPLGDYQVASVRRAVSVVFQDFGQYQLTARENIQFGDLRKGGSDENVGRAARATGADEVVAQLPHGYDTVLGKWFEGGHELSVGQWQKVAVARALFKEAHLVVLDEPTASMDARAEAAFFGGFRTALAGRAAVLISHRFSTVRAADRIIVIEHGRIAEQGTHDELVARAGVYAKLYALQARAFQ